MSDRVVIWEMPGCRRCAKAKARWPEAEVRSLSALMSATGDVSKEDHEAVVQFAMQDYQAPVVWVQGLVDGFVEVE